jgi:hypothetical protein
VLGACATGTLDTVSKKFLSVLNTGYLNILNGICGLHIMECASTAL